MQCGHKHLDINDTANTETEVKDFIPDISANGIIFVRERKPGEKVPSYAKLRKAAEKARLC